MITATKKLTGRIRGVNSSGNRTFGFIADATITLSDGSISVMSGTSRRNRGEAIRNMWNNWKQMCQEDFGRFVYVVNEGLDFHN